MKNLLIKLRPIITVIAFALLAAWPLLKPDFIPTHDGEYHLIRFFEFEKMLKSGYWFPRWAPDLNSGYGIPLFNFNYPLPNYLGVLYHVQGFSLSNAFMLTLATGYVMAVVFCFLWLRTFFSKQIAAAATIVFAFVPYWFVDIYVRGSVGEVLAIAWVMLALASIERNRVIFFVLAVTGLMLSHNILTVIFLPILIGYLLLRRPKYVWYLAISFGLSAYFWIPALAEQQYVTGLNPVNYRDHFAQLFELLVPSWGTGFSGSTDLGNKMSYQIGIVPLFILLSAIIFAFREKVKSKKNLIVFFGLAALGSSFLILEYSEKIWKLIPIMAFIQYPWRFLSVFLPISGFIAAYVFSKFKRTWLMWIITFSAVVLSYSYSRPVVYDPRNDNYYLTRINFTDGTSSLGNAFSTRWSDWKKTRAVVKIEIINGKGNVSVEYIRPLEYTFTATLATASTIRVNTLYYPGWTITIDNVRQNIDHTIDGTIRFTIPAGTHFVKVLFVETPMRQIADTISILSLFWLIFWAILKKYYENRHRRHSA